MLEGSKYYEKKIEQWRWEQLRRVAQLHEMVRAGLSDKVTFGQSPKEGGKVSHVVIGRTFPTVVN